jgi:cell division protease FtsH
MLSLPEEDRFLKSKKELIDNITQLLGGRVSEEMNFNDITSGAQNDLERATKITRKMVTEYGMSEKIGPVTFKGEEDEVFLGKEIASRPHYSNEIASEIDEEVRSIIMGCYDRAKKILTENRGILTILADELMKKETLAREEILKILSKVESKKAKRVEQIKEHDSEISDIKGKAVKETKKKSVKTAGKK